jgi:hypothetical protein
MQKLTTRELCCFDREWMATQPGPDTTLRASDFRHYRRGLNFGLAMVVIAHEPLLRAAAGAVLLDHLIGAQQDRLRHRKSKRLGGLEVDGHVEFRWQLNRKLRRFRAAQNAIDISGGPTKGSRAGNAASANAAIRSADVFDDNGCPSEPLICSARTRAIASVRPPAGNGTTKVMGRVG